MSVVAFSFKRDGSDEGRERERERERESEGEREMRERARKERNESAYRQLPIIAIASLIYLYSLLQ